MFVMYYVISFCGICVSDVMLMLINVASNAPEINNTSALQVRLPLSGIRHRYANI